MIKKRDIIICIIVAVVCLAGILAVFLSRGIADNVTITQNDKVLYVVSLYQNREINLEHNTVVIQNGKVYMKKADCKNQLCVSTPEISKDGEQIICLPNRVIVEVTQ